MVATDGSAEAGSGASRHGVPVVAPALVLALVVASWDVATRVLDVSARVLPSPGLVARSTFDDRADLWPAMETTTKEAVLGILVAIVVAVALAVVIDFVYLGSTAGCTR